MRNGVFLEFTERNEVGGSQGDHGMNWWEEEGMEKWTSNIERPTLDFEWEKNRKTIGFCFMPFDQLLRQTAVL